MSREIPLCKLDQKSADILYVYGKHAPSSDFATSEKGYSD